MRNWLIFILVVITTLSGQLNTSILSLSDRLDSDFNPAYIAVGSGETIFLMDPQKRQLAAIKTDNIVVYAGGFGRELDAFFDPTDLIVNNLEVIVCDRSEHRFLRFDLQLNYIGDFNLAESGELYHYPQSLSVDPWGALLAFSESSSLIIRIDNSVNRLETLIDLENQIDPVRCVADLAVSNSGETGVLFPCRNQVRIYNRFGRLQVNLPLDLDDPSILLHYKGYWLALNSRAEWQSGDRSRMGNVKKIAAIEGAIIHATVFNDRLYLLTTENIFIIRFEIKS